MDLQEILEGFSSEVISAYIEEVNEKLNINQLDENGGEQWINKAKLF